MSLIFHVILLLQKSDKSKEKWSGKQKYPESESTSYQPATLPPLPQPEEVKLTNGDIEQKSDAYPVAVTTTAVAEASVSVAPPTQAAAEVVRLPTISQYAGKSRDEVAAIKIQTAFRGYLVLVYENLCLRLLIFDSFDVSVYKFMNGC